MLFVAEKGVLRGKNKSEKECWITGSIFMLKLSKSMRYFVVFSLFTGFQPRRLFLACGEELQLKTDRYR